MSPTREERAGLKPSEVNPGIFVKTVDFHGTPVDVYVNFRGHFEATVDGGTRANATWEGLCADLSTRLRQANKAKRTKLAVPVTIIRPYEHEVRHGEVTGIHAGTGNVLFRCDGKTEQLTSMREEGFFDLTDEDREELTRLASAIKVAEKRFREAQDRLGHHVKAIAPVVVAALGEDA